MSPFITRCYVASPDQGNAVNKSTGLGLAATYSLNDLGQVT